MKVIIAGGTGFIGQALTKHLLQAGHEITVLGRHKEYIQNCLHHSVAAMSFAELKDQGKKALINCDAVINLSGANIAGKRWSDNYKKTIFSSRIETSHLLASLCAQRKADGYAPALLNASAVGIYRAYDTLQAQPDNESAAAQEPQTFLQRVAIAWESACEPAVAAGCRVVKMRFAPVLDNHGGLLAKMLLPYRLGLGAQLGSGEQPFPWIGLTDICQAIDWLLVHPDITGAINCVAPERVNQRTFSQALAKSLHRPHLMHIPARMLHLIFGEMADELLLTGADINCDKLLASGFAFQQPKLADFFS